MRRRRHHRVQRLNMDVSLGLSSTPADAVTCLVTWQSNQHQHHQTSSPSPRWRCPSGDCSPEKSSSPEMTEYVSGGTLKQWPERTTQPRAANFKRLNSVEKVWTFSEPVELSWVRSYQPTHPHIAKHHLRPPASLLRVITKSLRMRTELTRRNRPLQQLLIREADCVNVRDHFASRIISSWSSFCTRFTNRMVLSWRSFFISFVQRIRNDVEDDVMSDVEMSSSVTQISVKFMM